jgi:F-type H+-transporting ATPase subunit a
MRTVALGTHLLAADISVGEHVQKTFLGLTFNVDTIWYTAVAMALVLGFVFFLRARVTSGVPGKAQLLWEMVVGAVQQQVASSIGEQGAQVVPLAVGLFFFILFCNWLSVLGIGSRYEPVAPPTADVNLTLALALCVIIPVHWASVKSRGAGGYAKHYFKPYAAMAPLNFLEELVKPITLTLRLFGNLLSGALMLTLLAALGAWTIAHVPVGDVFNLIFEPIWKLFDLLIGAIQAFIFALLTILYFDTAMSHDEDHEAHDAHEAAHAAQGPA